jgi:LacI family transcriptional regulator
VLLAAKEINYRPNYAARMLKTQKSKTIALILPTDEANPNANLFYMDLLLGIMKKLSETDYDIIVSNYSGYTEGERSLRAVQVCQKQWVDAIILVPSSVNPDQLKVLRQMDVPFVLADRRVDDPDFSCVDSDNETGTARAVELLAKSGRKRIGFIGGAQHVSTGIARYTGYRKAIDGLGCGFGDELVERPKRYSIDDGGLCTKALLQKEVDGFVVSDNTLTMGAVLELNRQGVRIPDDVGIIGYDDFDWMELMRPPLTTVKQQVYHMGYLAADMVMRKLSGAGVNEKIMLDTSIVVRKSHGVSE